MEDEEPWVGVADLAAVSETMDWRVSERPRRPLLLLLLLPLVRKLPLLDLPRTKPRSRVAIESTWLYLCRSAKRLMGGSRRAG